MPIVNWADSVVELFDNRNYLHETIKITLSSKISKNINQFYIKQEVDDDLSACVLNLLHKLGSSHVYWP